MVRTENILLLGSFYIFAAQAQIQTDVNCEKFPLNPLCSFTQLNRLSVLDQPQLSLESPETHRSLDRRSEQYNPRDQRYYVPPTNHRVPNSWQGFSRPVPFGNHRPPLGQSQFSPNVRPNKRPSDSKQTNSNRKKRFFFWYTPADLLQAKKNHWKNKLQKFQKNAYQWKPPLNHLPYDEYDCVHGKLKPVSSNFLGGNSGGFPGLKGESFYNLNGQPVILASPLLLGEQLLSQNRPGKYKKKVPVNYAVEMEEENSEEGSDETKVSYIRDHAPEVVEDSNDSEESSTEQKEKVIKKKPKGEFELSPHGERIEFQVQGHNGPRTYIFGFDTGDGKNRQYRLEERMKDGTVKGQYGYYDARGKLRTIKYVARPLEGYKEKHHEVNLSDLS